MSEEYIKAVEENHAKMDAKITELINLVNEKQAENERLRIENAELKARLIEGAKEERKIVQLIGVDHAMARNWHTLALCSDGAAFSYNSETRQWKPYPQIPKPQGE